MLSGRPTKHARARGGFSMIELMIAIAIIGIMAMAIAPSLVEILADNRQGSSAWDLVRYARAARQESLAYGRSTLLRFQRSQALGLGAIERYSGMSSNCRQNAWNLMFGVGRPAPPSTRVFSMAAFNPGVESVDDVDRMVIRLQAFSVATGVETERTELQVCYAASGKTWILYDEAPGTLTEQRDDIILRITRQVSGIQRGVQREVLFRTGATARPM